MHQLLVYITENNFRKTRQLNKTIKQEKQKTMKTRLTQIILATFLFTIIIAGNVDAKGTEVVVVSGLENIVESDLELEDWMVNESKWNEFETYYATEFQEESLELQNWMVNENNWRLSNFEYPSKEAEQDLILENWMTNEVYWN